MFKVQEKQILISIGAQYIYVQHHFALKKIAFFQDLQIHFYYKFIKFLQAESFLKCKPHVWATSLIARNMTLLDPLAAMNNIAQ